ncbi:helix-turn-helix domain-containing protein [Brevundimonas faecalis]|uniref:Transcriptional regulator with XRE-family HTH domain n=1 Tax=Brevundimonas faecalis TaxID=947378 RepID=A0ABV2RCB0_9CAUL
MRRAADEDRKRRREIDAALGARLRAIRENHGLSQADMALKLGISTNQWGRHEAGINRVPASRLLLFSQFMQVDTTALFAGLPTEQGVTAPSAAGAARPASASIADAEINEGSSALVLRIAAAARELPEARQRTLLAVIRALKAEDEG